MIDRKALKTRTVIGLKALGRMGKTFSKGKQLFRGVGAIADKIGKKAPPKKGKGRP